MILLIDDDQPYNEALTDILNSEDGSYQIQTFTTGLDAINWLREWRKANSLPDVVIMDMMIPWDENDFGGSGMPDNPPALPESLTVSLCFSGRPSAIIAWSRCLPSRALKTSLARLA